MKRLLYVLFLMYTFSVLAVAPMPEGASQQYEEVANRAIGLIDMIKFEEKRNVVKPNLIAGGLLLTAAACCCTWLLYQRLASQHLKEINRLRDHCIYEIHSSRNKDDLVGAGFGLLFAGNERYLYETGFFSNQLSSTGLLTYLGLGPSITGIYNWMQTRKVPVQDVTELRKQLSEVFKDLHAMTLNEIEQAHFEELCAFKQSPQ